MEPGNDSLLELKVERTFKDIRSDHLLLSMLICKMGMLRVSASRVVVRTASEVISVKHLETCVALSKPSITFTAIIFVVHG